MVPMMREPRARMPRAETRDWSRFMGLEVSVGGNASSNAQGMIMGPVGVIVRIVNQPIPRRPGIATGDAGKDDTVAVIGGTADDLMVSVTFGGFVADPIGCLIDDSHRNIGSGSV